mmetsp:Transcript_83887/g.234124  ORF Transcript_83887/g.234124 Transcript_83887/m.234124 type:complete len:241 (+) Transcript_83887:1704-2426(+)
MGNEFPWSPPSVLYNTVDHVPGQVSAKDCVDAAKMFATCTLLQTSKPQPTSLFASMVCLRQQEPVEALPWEASDEFRLHHRKTQGDAVPFLGLWSTPQTAPPLSGSMVCMAEAVLNWSSSFLPATWLCQAGKISGMPWSSWNPATMKTMKRGRHEANTSTTMIGHLEMQSTRRKSAMYKRVSFRSELQPPADKSPFGVTVATTLKLSNSVRSLSLFKWRRRSFCLSRKTTKGGRKRRAST